MAQAMAIFYHEPMPDPETAARLDAGNSIYEYNDQGQQQGRGPAGT